MNRFIIVNGLPYLYANGKAFAVRWDDKGFTVGAEVELASAPSVTYSELSIKAKCAGNLDSIQDKQEAEQAEQPEDKQEAEQAEQPEELPDFEGMKLDDLKKYASDNNVALKGARTKAEIIEAIKSASEE